MVVRVLIRTNRYYDSVSLMAISQQIAALEGVRSAVVAMGTDMNKELLAHVGLLTAEGEGAGPSDLVLAVGADSEAVAQAAIDHAEGLLRQRSAATKGTAAAAAPRTLPSAVKANPGANLALISVPGAHAAREARIALEHGLNVMLYSDNVPVEAEAALKQTAREKGLLLMGPDCGTAIIAGVGLGFANAVRRGPIGIVAASGTGAQELSVLIDSLGSGVSQLIGVGGRDLSPQVGGIMMMEGIRRLQEDPETEVIVLVSKPPAPEVKAKLDAFVQGSPKKVISCLLGVEGAPSIDEVACLAVGELSGERRLLDRLGYESDLPTFLPRAGRTDVRGLFSGGTLCDQALQVLERALGPVTCNVHPDPARRGGVKRSEGHTLIDLGDDTFTVGRPHPMIDPTLRRQRLLEEADDPRTACILLDIVLGHGAHPDPAGALADAIRQAVDRGVAVVASVTGTEADPQGRRAQERTLKSAGAMVLPTARLAALSVAASLVRKEA